ncbi:hypothetical protein [Methylobrevis pamukkalensis]|uniref:Uncharacterized protein n=1 Tax=Methylobrevis pamukkalensis TaxID=1439726 RepID=A0A1E3H597_9HYPH|nr:hypothetical protein [Methylobrevis pamukkalensis]ODN71487.1 hypothetical protein A6302_01176 [Methylobrevis pamukkalensis]
MEAWLNDADPGLSATMIAVDKGLRRGERWLGCADKAAGLAERIACRVAGRRKTPPKATPVPPATPGEAAAGEGI